MTEQTGHNPVIDDSPEIWKPIPGYESWYDASNKGRIRSWWKKGGKGKGDKPTVIKGRNNRRGYLGVYLSSPDRGRCQFTVHRLIALTFLGPRPNGSDINHKNGIRTDNRLDNLEYVTRSKNLIHARDELDGTQAQILTRQQAEEVIALLTEGVLSQVQIATRYSVSSMAISCIWACRSWIDLPRSYLVGKYTYPEWRKMQREKRQGGVSNE